MANNGYHVKRHPLDRKLCALLFVVSWLSYAFFFQPPANPNSMSRLLPAIALAERGTLAIDAYQHLTIDKARRGNHYFSDKAPGVTMIAVPVVAAAYPIVTAMFDVDLAEAQRPASRTKEWLAIGVLAYVSTVLSCGLFSALSIAWLYIFALRYGNSRMAAVVAALTLGLATPFWGWSTALFGHALAAASLFLAFTTADAIRVGEQSRRTACGLAFLCGVLISWSATVEFPAAPAGLVVGLYAIWRVAHTKKPLVDAQCIRICSMLALTAGALIMALPLLLYNLTVFGSPLAVGYQYVVGFGGMSEGISGVTFPKLEVLYEILFGSYRGIVWISPVLLLTPVALYKMNLKSSARPAAVVCSVIGVYFLLFNSSYVYWAGGFSVGPRHITPALPFLCLSFAWLWNHGSRTLKIIFLILAIFSFAVSFLCVSVHMDAPNSADSPLLGYLIKEAMALRLEGIVFWYRSNLSPIWLPVILLPMLAMWLFSVGKIIRWAGSSNS